MHLFILTLAAMIAFASNSLLTRAAVDGGHIDPAGFAILRVLAGAIVLAGLVSLRQGRLPSWRRANVGAAMSLTAYMIGFSLAYLTLDAGLGALILFGVVQVTMFMHAGLRGDAPSARQMSGAGIAFAGLVVALLPETGGNAGLAGAFWMILAGIGWAGYTIIGRQASDPLAATAMNFLICLPVLCLCLAGSAFDFSVTGIGLAAICGGVTSGLGYALWYHVLPRMTSNVAAIAQLSVPVIAIIAGVVLLDEAMTWRIMLSAMLVLGGIAFALRITRK